MFRNRKQSVFLFVYIFAHVFDNKGCCTQTQIILNARFKLTHDQIQVYLKVNLFQNDVCHLNKSKWHGARNVCLTLQLASVP